MHAGDAAEHVSLNVCMCVRMCACMCVCMCVCVFMYARDAAEHKKKHTHSPYACDAACINIDAHTYIHTNTHAER